MIEGFINAVSVCGPGLLKVGGTAAQFLPGNNSTLARTLPTAPSILPPTNDAALAPRFGWR